MKKKLICCLLATAMISSLLSGCGSGKEEKADETAKEDGKVTICIFRLNFFIAIPPSKNVRDFFLLFF